MDQLLSQLSEAVASQNWLVVVAISAVIVATLVGVVLKLIGKDVPLLGKIIDIARGLIPMLPKKAPPAPEPGKVDGVAGVVPVVKTEDTLK